MGFVRFPVDDNPVYQDLARHTEACKLWRSGAQTKNTQQRRVSMLKTFEKSLSKLESGPVRVSGTNAYPQAGQASVELLFADGSKLEANYWRVIRDGKAGISSFDHQQRYGLPAPLDSVKELQTILQDKRVIKAQLDKETGDLLFQFTENVKLQVLNVTGYEVWTITFPDGTGEYSNYAK